MSYRDRARMIQVKVQVEVEADAVAAGRDLGRLGLAAMSPRALVAAEVGRADPVVVVRHEAKVMLADVLVGASADSVEHQMGEEEVGRGHRGGQSQSSGGNGGEVHLEGGEVFRGLSWLLVRRREKTGSEVSRLFLYSGPGLYRDISPKPVFLTPVSR